MRVGNIITRKKLLALLFAVFPPASIIATTPTASLNEHILHIILVTVMGIGMAAYILKDEVNHIPSDSTNHKKTSLFGVAIFIVLFAFFAVHAMPCPYMFSPNMAQTMLNHPCSQPVTPSMPEISFILEIGNSISQIIDIPHTFISIASITSESRAPPRS